MSSSFARLELSPPQAIAVLVATHIALVLAAIGLGSFGAVSEVVGLLSVLAPGMLAGYLTKSKPVLVAAIGSVANFGFGLLASLLMFGALPLSMMLFSFASDLLQAAITVGACVGTFALRRRLSSRHPANVN